MRRILIAGAALLALIGPAKAVDSTVTGMTAASALGGTELLYVVQGAADRKGTPAQFATYIYGLATGDCTISGGGAVICTKTNGVAFGALATTTPGTGVATALGVNVGSAGAFVVNGSALGTPSSGTLISATGLPISTGVSGLAAGIATFLAAPSSANLLAAMTTSTGTGVNVFGTAPTISSLNATVAMTLAFLTGSTQCLQVNTSGVVSGTGVACGSGGGAVSSVTGGVGITVSPTTGAVVVSAPVTSRNNTATSDTIVAGDAGTVVTESNASPVAVGIAAAGGAGFLATTPFSVKNKGAGVVTITPTTSTIDGAANLTLAQNQSVDFYSDGTNYITLPGRATGGTANTIASGTAALGTSAIASAACATVVTSTATGTATTDVVTASFNGDPTAVTGYIPATTGMLTIIAYPTANNANFKVCNNTNASITPGAITLNWRVVR